MFNKVYDKLKKIIKENYIGLIVIIFAFLLFTVEFPYYISAPGGIINTSEKVNVTTEFKMSGSLNMAYVSEVKATAPIIVYATLNKNWDIKTIDQVTVGNESIDDKKYRDKKILEEGNNLALLVAYNHSNIDYEIENNEVYVTYVDSLAKTTLKVGDQILEIDGKKIKEKQDLYKYIESKKINEKIIFKVKNNNKTKYKKATLISVNDEPKVGVIITETINIKSDHHVELKFKGSESGSSGGMMMALTIYSYLNEIDLTKGKKIVGTGTIDKEGNVGQISGIKYKLIGAVKEKADIFLVPQGENYQEARNLKKQQGYAIDIIPVETFKDALKYLNM